MNMLKDAKEYAYDLFIMGFTFNDFAKQYPNLANCGYGLEVKEELERLNK